MNTMKRVPRILLVVCLIGMILPLSSCVKSQTEPNHEMKGYGGGGGGGMGGEGGGH